MPVFALDLGDDAPDFRLLDQEGFSHTLIQHRGQYVLLFFYPRDFTPSGIRKIQAFEKMYTFLKEKNVIVYGISNDFCPIHQAFHEKFHLTYDLLSDPDSDVIRVYGAHSFLGTKTLSYLVGPDGRIFRKYDGSKGSAHSYLVLEDLQ